MKTYTFLGHPVRVLANQWFLARDLTQILKPTAGAFERLPPHTRGRISTRGMKSDFGAGSGNRRLVNLEGAQFLIRSSGWAYRDLLSQWLADPNRSLNLILEPAPRTAIHNEIRSLPGVLCSDYELDLIIRAVIERIAP